MLTLISVLKLFIYLSYKLIITTNILAKMKKLQKTKNELKEVKNDWASATYDERRIWLNNCELPNISTNGIDYAAIEFDLLPMNIKYYL